MASARDEIFASLRRSMGVTGQEATRKMEVQTRLMQKPRGIVPQRGYVAGEERIELFTRQAQNVQADVKRAAHLSDVAPIVRAYLRERNLPALLRRGQAPLLHAIDWDAQQLTLLDGPSDGHDANGLSVALGGCAETGSLVLVSGPDNPTTLNFLPDNHIVLIEANKIEPSFEDIWQKLRMIFGPDTLPRTVNFITGPSRSADIEQTMLLGAHGPRNLLIVIIG
jgi:L-lactate dehydrogenase complex protein LldG